MRQFCTTVAMSTIFLITGCSSTVSRPSGSSNIDPKAQQTLRAMCDVLSKSKAFSFQNQSISEEPIETGQLVQFASERKVFVRKPNKLFVERSGDLGPRSSWYDGHHLTVLDKSSNIYASISVPGTLEKMLDYIMEKYDLTIPLSDLLFPNLYETLTSNVKSGRYVGLHHVGETRCHHLSFTQETVDWQIWIEQGKTPLPRKVLIIYKNQPNTPHYQAVLDNWNLSPKLSDKLFEFHPPSDSRQVKIDVLLKTDEEENDE